MTEPLEHPEISEIKAGSAVKLNELMQFEHVIRVREDGSIEDGLSGIWAPEVNVDTDADGQILDVHEREMVESIERQGWQLLTGWSGQYRYSGPIMHPSEFIGGSLEEYIRETPGYYCAVAVETLDDNEEAAGWVIAYREKHPSVKPLAELPTWAVIKLNSHFAYRRNNHEEFKDPTISSIVDLSTPGDPAYLVHYTYNRMSGRRVHTGTILSLD